MVTKTKKKAPAKKAEENKERKSAIGFGGWFIIFSLFLLTWAFIILGLNFLADGVDLRRMVQQNPMQLVAMEERLEKAERQISSLKIALEKTPQIVKTPDGGGVAELRQKITMLERAVKETKGTIHWTNINNKMGPAVIALVDLRQKIQSGRKYVKELDVVKKLFATENSISKQLKILQERADKGIKTLAHLKDEFPAMAMKIVQAARESGGQNTDAMDRLLAKFSRVVSIRKVDTKGDSVEAIIARAEEAMARHDLAAAVKEMAGLKAAAAEAATGWLDEAESRAKAELAIEKIYDNLMDLYSGKDGADKNSDDDR